jgi:hypothetical protein
MTTIATFNVHVVTPALLKWLGETRYEIVGLQELTSSDEKFPADAIGQAGYGDRLARSGILPPAWQFSPGGRSTSGAQTGLARRSGRHTDPAATRTQIGELDWLPPLAGWQSCRRPEIRLQARVFPAIDKL